MSEFVVEGETYQMVGVDKLTFAEGDAIERVTGLTLDEVGGDGSTPTRVVQALVWVSMKRRKPELKFSDLADLVIGDIEWPEPEAEDDDESDPTQPADAGDPSDD